DSTQTWTVGGHPVAATQLTQAVTNSLVKRLSQKGLVRVRQLDVQCCTLQVEVLDANANENSQQPHLSLNTRITLLDVDKQHVYSKEYRGEAPAKAKGSKAGTAAAADDVASRVIADNEFMHALAGS
ncbi:MAG: hypothetical protein QOJ99_5799, partial [Bryobacterales bacterium]|nr:hypothetical protein [Bryobacterales bacterium]